MKLATTLVFIPSIANNIIITKIVAQPELHAAQQQWHIAFTYHFVATN
jgi:hypothetical protein